MKLGAVLLAGILAGPVAASVGPGLQEDEDLSGTWSGGFGRIGGDAPSWPFLRCDILAAGNRLKGTATVPEWASGVALHGTVEGHQVELHIQGFGAPCVARGTWQGDWILGTATQGDVTHEFQLCRIQTLTVDEILTVAGIYGSGDRRVALSQFFATGQLVCVDLESGVSRVLFPGADDHHTAGPALFVPHPVERQVRIERDEDGRPAALVLQEQGVTTRLPKTTGLRHEDFSFQSDGVTLEGRLTLPEAPGVYPALVVVYGSGPATREHVLHWPPFYVQHGIAVLAFDKRGCGESGGTYNTRDIVRHTLQRGADVHAAVRALQQHPEVDPDAVGLAGGSQAGWVSAVAAASGDCAFVIVQSGGAVCYARERLYSQLTRELESRASNASIEEVLPAVRAVEVDYDWTPHFAAIPCPALYLYGLRDRINPSILCVEFLENIAREHGCDFTILPFPTGSHAMFDARLGGAAELGTLDRMAPGYLQAIEDWLQEKRLVHPDSPGAGR